VGRIGGTEIALGKTDPARKVQTSGDWTVSWHAASKAVVFAFPHRSEELREWGDYMASEFSAKQVSTHHKLIAFDKAVRAMVRGGKQSSSWTKINSPTSTQHTFFQMGSWEDHL
jgi:hypothetical protein